MLGYSDFYDESKIPFHNRFKGPDNPAFDRRALKDPGEFGPVKFIGRKGYSDSMEDIQRYSEKNPYPALSAMGMTLYLPALVERDVDDIVEAQKYMRPFLKMTTATVSGAADAWKLFAPLGEVHEGGQQHNN